jgi:hypothetical protein
MKTVKTIIAFAAIVASFSSYATIRRVDANPANNAPFTTIQAAHDAATAGDTIQIAGAATSYAGASFTKQLVIIGPGYFLGENIDTQANKSPAKISTQFIFKTGSNGSFVMGLYFDLGSDCIDIEAGVNNLVIKRNYLRGDGAVRFNSTNGAAINNTTIQQNYFDSHPITYSYTVTNNNILLLNNYMEGSVSGINGSTLVVKHNIINTTENFAFNNSNQIANSTIQNNIIIITGGSPITGLGLANSFTNNLCNISLFGTANGNQEPVSMATVFEVDPATSNPSPFTTDSRWTLKAATSPALAAGASGEDCGIYGGTDPYVLSGLPSIPAIYELTAPTSASQSGGLNVTIKAKSH